MADDNKQKTTTSSNRFAISIGPFRDWQFRETMNEGTGSRNLPVRPPGDGWHIAEVRDRSTVWRRLVTVPAYTIDVGGA
jgi:hypothetical protein